MVVQIDYFQTEIDNFFHTQYNKQKIIITF